MLPALAECPLVVGLYSILFPHPEHEASLIFEVLGDETYVISHLSFVMIQSMEIRFCICWSIFRWTSNQPQVVSFYLGVSKNTGTSKMDGLYPIKIDDLGVSLFLETPIYVHKSLFVFRCCRFCQEKLRQTPEPVSVEVKGSNGKKMER